MEKEEIFEIKIIAYHRVQVGGGCKLKPSVDFESKPRKTTTTDITKTTVTKIFVEKYDKVLLLFGFSENLSRSLTTTVRTVSIISLALRSGKPDASALIACE